ncbi:MAG: PAS domain S-box protein [Verrucomicrobia bacterium]|nr:PAS domain S-box protein [Verrucomicrobiota bacterium]
MILDCCAWLTAGAEGTAKVSTMLEFYDLQPELAKTGLSVQIKGVVLCYDLEWNQLYIHDGVSTDYFDPKGFSTQPQRGELVELSGRTSVKEGRPSLVNLDLRVLGESTPPPAKSLDLPRLSNDIGQWIETTGEVRVAETSLGRLSLLIRSQEQECRVYVLGGPTGTNDFTRLMGCEVRVRGINGSKVTNGRLDSAIVFASGLDEITVLSQPEADPRLVPVVSIDSLYNRELGSWTNNRVHLCGVITSARPGEDLVISDMTGVIRARVIQATPVQKDQRVEVWGFFTSTATDAFLDHAYFEIAPPPTLSSLAPPQIGDLSVQTNLPGVLTRAAQIRKLPRELAAQRIPIRLTGVMTYTDAEWQLGFIQDRSGGIFVAMNQPEIRPGQWVELTGRTDPGGYVPMIIEPEYRVLGSTNMPFAIKADLEDLASGHLDGQWIEMQGVVRRMIPNGNHVYLSLATPKGGFKALIPDFRNQELPTHLIDALVTIQGACGSELNARGQLAGVTLHVPSLDYVTVLEQPPEDPFAVETVTIESVAVFDPERLAGRRVKISGAVTAEINLRGFYLQDSSGGIRIHTQSMNEINTGDFVEVLGFPALGGFSPHLEEAIVSKTTPGTPPQIIQSEAEQILLRGTNDCMLVELNARLLQNVPNAANPRLVLQDGAIIFFAEMASPAGGRKIPALEAGSRVRLKGVCSIESGEDRVPTSFRVILREPEDLELLERPPMWTTRHTYMLAGGLSLLVLCGLAWVGSLRRTVNLQTEVIREKLRNVAALEQRYRELFQNSDELLFTSDTQGKCVYANRSVEQFFGLSETEITGRPIADIVCPESRTLIEEKIGQVLAGRQVARFEVNALREDGKPRVLEVGFCIMREDERPFGVQCAARDVTERRELTESLSREKNLLGTIIDHIPDNLFVKDSDGRFLLSNRAHMRFHGLDSKEMALGRTAADIVPSSAARLFADSDRRVLLDGRIITDQEEIVADRTLRNRFLLTTKVPLLDGAGNIVGLVGISRDVTERKQAENRLRQLSSAVEQSPVSIVITNVAGDIEYANPAFCRSSGYSLAELVGRDIRSLKSSESSQTDDADSWWLATADTEWKGVVRCVRKDGNAFWEQAQISSIRNADGHTVKMLGIFEDVTERRELEAQLRQAQKMDSIGRLAAGLAHDINNMLTVIQGHCSFVSDNAVLPEVRQSSVDEILRAAGRMTNLIRQLLMFSRKQPTRPRLVDSNELISNLMKMLRHLLGERVELECVYRPNLPSVMADSAMIEQVIVNLSVNARDAMPTGGRLSIRTEYVVLDAAPAARNSESRPGCFVALTVEDTGSGMDDATLQHLFEPFFTTKEVGKGTGLGLASVYGIVKQHQGWIEVVSQPLEGSRFTVFLPAVMETIAPSNEKPLEETPVPHGDETILLVEDEPALRHAVEKILKSCGYRVLSSENGDAALAVWADHSSEIDLLLTDLIMPGETGGRQLAKRLCAEKPTLKTIFTSGYSVDLTGEKGLLSEGVHFLQKPYKFADLARLLRECLDERPERQQHLHGI